MSELLQVYDTREEAVRHMHEYAAKLRQLKVTHRYGVYVKTTAVHGPRATWGVYVRDRQQ